MKTRHIQIVLAGTALTMGLAGCPKDSESTSQPAVGKEPVVPPIADPPTPAPAAEVAGAPEATLDLPTWNEVVSGHPQGATNPPTPELIVTPDGDCYKRWVGRMRRPDGVYGDRVEACPDPDVCGTQIQCPPEAGPMLEAWKAEQGGDAP